ncbi:MAG: hypothetical protein ACFB0C_21305 [Leptolyngbyaceae cyanobacterium]
MDLITQLGSLSGAGRLALMVTLALLHCLVGLLAAKVAHGKGRNLDKWLMWGLIGGTPTLIAACLCKPQIEGDEG